MRFIRERLAALVICVEIVVSSLGMTVLSPLTVQATEVQNNTAVESSEAASTVENVDANSDSQLTPEEQLQLELQTVYGMPVQSNSYRGWPQGPGTYGESAIVMEVGTGAVLYAKNIDERQYPASITKVLTALVALENGKLTDTVTFSRDCVAFMKPGDSSVGLKEGNEITLEQALHAMLLASANEAAYAIGENVGRNAGHDYNWFIEQMNRRCKELGGENSNFVNTNGLHDENHYTTARDMALIGRELFKHPEFFRIVQTLNYVIPETEMVEEHVFQQKHKMLNPGRQDYYEYAVGGKTGYTSNALSTLITMTDNGQTQLVCVVLRTHGKNVYPDTRNLFEYAFQNFSKVKIAGQETADWLEDVDGEAYVMLPNGMDFQALDKEIRLEDAETRIGTVTYTYEGNVMGSAQIHLTESYVDKLQEENGDQKEISVSIKSTETKEELPEAADSADQTKGAMHRLTSRQVILTVLCVILVGLIIAFCVMVVRVRRKRNRRRKR